MALHVAALALTLLVAPADDAATTQAKAEVRAAFEAADKEDYDAAIGHFERALELRPTPRLHFNIAVIHHRKLSGLKEGAPGYEDARRAAVDEYNAYLSAAPDAKDKRQVERTILSLGGRPVTLDDWSVRPREEPTAPPELVEDGEPAGPTVDADPDDRKPIAGPDRQPPSARVGFGAATWIMGLRSQSRTDDVVTAPFVGGVVRGGAFLGPRHRLNFGGEFALGVQPTTDKQRHHLLAGHLAIVLEYGHPVAKNMEVGGGGLIGIVGQQLRHNGESTMSCPLDAGDNPKISERAGLILAGRFVYSFLLGKHRNHELSLRLTPGIVLTGEGRVGSRDEEDAMGMDPCRDGPAPFEQAGIDNGAELVVTFDVGYAPRF